MALQNTRDGLGRQGYVRVRVPYSVCLPIPNEMVAQTGTGEGQGGRPSSKVVVPVSEICRRVLGSAGCHQPFLRCGGKLLIRPSTKATGPSPGLPGQARLRVVNKGGCRQETRKRLQIALA
jgi:hypothetical protein